MRRAIAVVSVIGLLSGGIAAGPAAAKGKCRKASGDNGPVMVVTDKATERKPIATTVATTPGLAFTGDEPTYTHGYVDIQVDSRARYEGLWVRIAVPPSRDYDLYLLQDGQTIAASNGWNPGRLIPVYEDFIPDAEGSDTEWESETITGKTTHDCDVYTIDVAIAMGEGGDVPVEIWLGEIKF